MRNKNQPIKYKLSDYNLWNLPTLPSSSRGRVVKAIDQKSIGLCPRRFESCRLRTVLLSIIAGQLVISVISLGVGQKTQRRACHNLQLYMIKFVVVAHEEKKKCWPFDSTPYMSLDNLDWRKHRKIIILNFSRGQSYSTLNNPIIQS